MSNGRMPNGRVCREPSARPGSSWRAIRPFGIWNSFVIPNSPFVICSRRAWLRPFSIKSPGVWRSTDGGVTWTASLMQCYANNGFFENIYTGWMGDGVDYDYGWGLL